MKEKPVFPLLVSMALPMVISMLVNSLYNIVDSFFVAQISEDAMTALSLVYPVQNFVNAVAIGFGIGLNAVISYYLGAGDKKAAGCAATQGLALTMLHAVILTIGSLLVIERVREASSSHDASAAISAFPMPIQRLPSPTSQPCFPAYPIKITAAIRNKLRNSLLMISIPKAIPLFSINRI